MWNKTRLVLTSGALEEEQPDPHICTLGFLTSYNFVIQSLQPQPLAETPFYLSVNEGL